jgi:ribokinase
MIKMVCCDAGENAIVIVTGANNKLSFADVRQASEIIRMASVTVFQFETPIETTIEALKIAKQGEGL